MLFTKALPEAVTYASALSEELRTLHPSRAISKKGLDFISFCLTALIVCGIISWERFERSSLGAWTSKALSWMFHKSPMIPWDKLLIASTNMLLKLYRITGGDLVVDDYDRHRSKRTTRIFGVHKIHNKKGGGFVDAQNIVLLILVTRFISIPVGFRFFVPDPDQKEWRKNDRLLRKKGVKKADRPLMPLVNIAYPSKKQLAMSMLRSFRHNHGKIKISAILADSLFFDRKTRAECSRIYPEAQFISQLRSTQHVLVGNRKSISLKDYFSSRPPRKKTFRLRSGLEKTIEFVGARVRVKSHGRKYHIVAYRYESEEKYRFLCASDQTWLTDDIITKFAYRWLVEVCIEDLKVFHGCSKGAIQQGIEGARRGVCLSLLLDHFLISHPKQLDLHRTHQPMATAGSLQLRLQFEALLSSMREVVESPNPKAVLRDWTTKVENLIELRPSKKHMNSYKIEEIRDHPALRKRFQNSA